MTCRGTLPEGAGRTGRRGSSTEVKRTLERRGAAVTAVLGVLVVLLGATSWLLRRKEREPDEGKTTEDIEDTQGG